VIVLPVKSNAPPGSFDSDGELVSGDEDKEKLQVPALKERKSGEALAIGTRRRKVPVIVKTEIKGVYT
jgi:hypothetical protein